MVSQLVKLFPHSKELLLYERLLLKLLPTDEHLIQRHFNACKSFFSSYEEDIPKRAVIPYNDRIFISVGKFFDLLGNEDKRVFLQHLRTLRLVVLPEERETSIVKEGEGKLDIPSSAEGEFLKSLISKTKNTLSDKGISPGNASTAEAFNAMAFSGIVGDVFQDVAAKIGSGDIKIENLMGLMMNTMSSMSNNTEDRDISNVAAVVEEFSKKWSKDS
jgi:hypothetical protein